LKKRPEILTIAGFDPSGGAGILADIKTFEQNKCLGVAVQTANTIQTESEFKSVNWTDEKLILDQLATLYSKHSFDYVKIGLMQSEEILTKILDWLTGTGQTKVIWDPILKSSSGFVFHENLSKEILRRVYLITPNWDEVKILGGNENAIESARHLSKYCKVLLKGGHRTDFPGKDLLFTGEQEFAFNGKPGTFYPKHGSGCVFSAALTANLTKGYPLNKAILRSKRYVERFLNSSKGLTGYHHNQ